MRQFIMTYHGGSQPKIPENGKAHMDRYMAWIGTLDAVVKQQPLNGTETPGTTKITPMIGYSISNAPDMVSARKIAAVCPFLDMDNSAMQVSDLIEMG